MNTLPVLLNGAARQVTPGTTLAEFIAATGQPPQALSTALNGVFVARDARAAMVLSGGDAVLTFHPITGG